MPRKTNQPGKRPQKARKAAKRSIAAKTAQIRARIDPAVKEKAEGILEDLGLNPSAAISTFYRQIVMRHGLPFPVEVPNAATKAAIEKARRGDDLIEGRDLQDMLAKLLNKRERSVDLAELVESNPDVLTAFQRG